VLERNRLDVDVEAVRTIVGELVANFAEHAQGPFAAFAMQVLPRANHLDIAVGDCGVGIRTSLARNPRHMAVLAGSHAQAAMLAIQPAVGGRVSGEGGWGLHLIHDEVRRLGGLMRLYTGDGGVVASGTQVRHGALPFDLPGVQILVRLDYAGSRG